MRKPIPWTTRPDKPTEPRKIPAKKADKARLRTLAAKI